MKISTYNHKNYDQYTYTRMKEKVAVCAVFDIGKTNKKILLFDENYKIVAENLFVFEEIADDDGFACEDLQKLSQWIRNSFEALLNHELYELKAINFSTYGASLVHLDVHNQAVTPLYNYLKPFPKSLKKEFYDKYGDNFLTETASPDLGFLNSGLQLYWLKYTKPSVFAKIKNALHFPQYCAFLISNELTAEPTSLGSHTALWSFTKNAYHHWLAAEKINTFEQIIRPSTHFFEKQIGGKSIAIGIGIHDSSAALLPYLYTFNEPFVLLSTGTWSIAFNPFNHKDLTKSELEKDCLCYLTYENKPVKASRIFAGNEHERQTKHLATYFNKDINYFKNIRIDKTLIRQLRSRFIQATPNNTEIGALKDCLFVERNLNHFKNYEEAYHQFMLDLMAQQVASLKLVIANTAIKKIFVDGGFSKNSIFMNLLAEAFHDKEVYASEIAQATALGAALLIEKAWTNKKFEAIQVQKYG